MVVRVCDPSYDKNKLEQSGIKVIVIICTMLFLANSLSIFIFTFTKLKDAAFPDGSTPPTEVRDEWFGLLKEKFEQAPDTCIAIHCVACLGR